MDGPPRPVTRTGPAAARWRPSGRAVVVDAGADAGTHAGADVHLQPPWPLGSTPSPLPARTVVSAFILPSSRRRCESRADAGGGACEAWRAVRRWGRCRCRLPRRHRCGSSWFRLLPGVVGGALSRRRRGPARRPRRPGRWSRSSWPSSLRAGRWGRRWNPGRRASRCWCASRPRFRGGSGPPVGVDDRPFAGADVRGGGHRRLPCVSRRDRCRSRLRHGRAWIASSLSSWVRWPGRRGRFPAPAPARISRSGPSRLHLPREGRWGCP